MKRSFLEQLGITDKDTLDKIMAENGADIQREKGRWESTQNELDQTKTLLSQRESRISELEKSKGDVDALNQQISTLTAEKTALVEQHSKELSGLKMEHGLESMARDYGARNVKAALALLDRSKISMENDEITGAKEQFDSLKGADETKFLFSDGTPIAGAEPSKGNPPTGGDPKPQNFRDAIAAHYAKGSK